MKYKFNFFLFLFVFVFFFNSNLYSAKLEVLDVKIQGNKSISNETILNIINFNKTTKFFVDDNDLSLIKKKLFETNFFEKIDLIINANVLKINLVENPLIDYITISGLNDREDYKKFIEKNISLKSNNIFSQYLLNSDLNLIKKYLSSLGYYKSKITFQVNQIDNNKVNIFFDIDLNKQFLIKNIFFIGDKKFSSSTLAGIITSSRNNFLNLFNSSSVPSEDRINYDISLLKNFYLEEGYYEVQITNSSIDILDNYEANLTFSINAGNKFFINKNSLKHNFSFVENKDISYLNNILKKLEKNYYNYKKINSTRQELVNYLDEAGIRSEVTFGIEKISDSNLNITFKISEITEKKIISNIYVSGNDITEERVIRNNLLFSEGDLYNDYKINKSKDLLKSLRIFKNIDLQVTDDKNNNKLIKILVTEMPTGEIASGIGIGSSGSTLGFNLKEKNFLGKGIVTDVNLNFGTQQVVGQINFSDPDFLDSGNFFSNSLFVLRDSYKAAGYENKLIGNNVLTRYEIFQDVSFENGFGISYDSVDITNTSSNILTSQDGNFLTTKIFYSFFNDKRNSLYNATSGYTFGFGQDYALPPSDVSFVANKIFGTYYHELGKDYKGTAKYILKSINSIDSDPVKLSDRVFLSDTQLRGFSFRGIGPKVGADYIGGNYSFASTLSTTIPNGLPEQWNTDTSIFIDIGNVWGVDMNRVDDSNKIRSSIGTGVTWTSPIGPISLSYAIPISKSSTDDVENFNFRIGKVF